MTEKTEHFKALINGHHTSALADHVTSTGHSLKWDVTNTGNGERGTGNGEPGTEVWELMYSGNPLENSKWRSKQKKRSKRNNLSKGEFPPAVPPDGQYVLVRAESN